MDFEEFDETGEGGEYEGELFFEKKFDREKTAEEEKNDDIFDWFPKFVYKL